MERLTNFACGALIGAFVTYRVLKQCDTNLKTESTVSGTAAKNSSSLSSVGSGKNDNDYDASEFHVEQLSRNKLYFGDSGLVEITKASVVVVGLGGVGSHCAHLLARSGIKYISLVDFDQVTLSSTNRHACARLRDVGKSKVGVMKEFIGEITISERQCKVNAIQKMFNDEIDAITKLLIERLNSQDVFRTSVQRCNNSPSPEAIHQCFLGILNSSDQ